MEIPLFIFEWFESSFEVIDLLNDKRFFFLTSSHIGYISPMLLSGHRFGPILSLVHHKRVIPFNIWLIKLQGKLPSLSSKACFQSFCIVCVKVARFFEVLGLIRCHIDSSAEGKTKQVI